MHVIAFDLDDTLYPEREFAHSGFRVVARYLQRRSGIEYDLRRIMADLFENGHRGDIFNRALDSAGIPHDEELIGELVDVYRRHTPDIHLYADAMETLKALHDRGDLRLAIITDGHFDTQARKVSRLGVASLIPKIVYTDVFGRKGWKPSPAGYLEVQRHYGVPGSACVYIGDNPRKDFITAKHLGWRTVRVIRADGVHRFGRIVPESEADFIVESLREATAVLSRTLIRTGSMSSSRSARRPSCP